MVTATLRIGKRKVSLKLPDNPDIQEDFIKSVQGLASEKRLDSSFLCHFEALTQDPAILARWELDQEYDRLEATFANLAEEFRRDGEEDGQPKPAL